MVEVKRLLRETIWSRVYLSSGGMQMYESKLRDADSVPTLHFVEKAWHEWTQPERFDFAKAFAARKRISTKDEEVLKFLISDDDDIIASAVATSVGRIHDSRSAAELLRKRMSSCKEPRANFYTALARFENDPLVLSALEGEYRRLEKLFRNEQNDLYVAVDYFECASSLAKLTRSKMYLETIKAHASKHENRAIRQAARSTLNSPPARTG